jgi:hypothetical protein
LVPGAGNEDLGRQDLSPMAYNLRWTEAGNSPLGDLIGSNNLRGGYDFAL